MLSYYFFAKKCQNRCKKPNLSIEKKSNLKDKILNSLNSMDEKCSFLCDVCGELDIEV